MFWNLCAPILRRTATLILAIPVVTLLSQLARAEEPTDELLQTAQSTFGIIESPDPASFDRPAIQLGRRLFWDERLSANGKVACASCHSAATWGADSEQFSLDAKNKRTKRNSQTVFNSTLQPALRWTGDRKSAAHQAEKSLTGSMGFGQAEDVVARLNTLGYGPLFQVAFADEANPVSPANYAKAIDAYEATLLTPAPFDEFLKGSADALSESQQAGLRLFLEIGCADCHSGKLLGGENLEKFGVHHEYWTATSSNARDAGLFESTNKEDDRYRFRTSMLRNVEKTAPYFHDGSVPKLADAIRVMAKVQLDKELDTAQIASIESFLSSLTGAIPKNYSAPETLEPAGK